MSWKRKIPVAGQNAASVPLWLILEWDRFRPGLAEEVNSNSGPKLSFVVSVASLSPAQNKATFHRCDLYVHFTTAELVAVKRRWQRFPSWSRGERAFLSEQLKRQQLIPSRKMDRFGSVMLAFICTHYFLTQCFSLAQVIYGEQ